MSEATGGVLGPPPTASELVRKMLDLGYAVPVQAQIKKGYIVYEFIGGIYDGVKIRLYPPFLRRVEFGDTYVLGPPKNGRSARLTFRLEE